MSVAPITNNVDIAMREVRTLQSMILDNKVSNQKVFDHTHLLMQRLEMASKEIKVNYEEISAKLTEQMNTGRVPKS